MSDATLNLLPTLNATLNGAAALLLLSGYLCIRQGWIRAHATLMISAFVLSLLFLASYLTYHSVHGITRFTETGWIRPLYFSVLGSHTVLAAVVPFLAVITLWRALHRRFVRHRKIARWTLPIWLYVSLTGVLVYGLLYHWRF